MATQFEEGLACDVWRLSWLRPHVSFIPISASPSLRVSLRLKFVFFSLDGFKFHVSYV